MFVFLSPGRTGLMPLSETGLDRDADVMKAFPVGSEVEVAVHRGRCQRPPHTSQQEGRGAAAGASGVAGVCGQAGRHALDVAGVDGRRAARRPQTSVTGERPCSRRTVRSA